MKRGLTLLAGLAFFALAPAFAQFGSLRAVTGLGIAAGYGTIGAELEVLDDTVRVYPRGSVAYLFGIGGLFSPPYWGFNVQVGAAIYSDFDRTGFFAAARGGVGLIAQNTVGAFVSTASLTGGYRWLINGLELGIEGGVFFASQDLGSYSLVGITPTLAVSAGYRF